MSTNPKKRTYRLRDGVSLLISLGLVSVIVFFGLIVSNIVVTSIRQAANVNRANEAYYAAEGALEQGLMLNSKQGAGYSAGSQAATGLDAEFTIQGQVPVGVQYGGVSGYTGMYSAPAPGTGNIETDCDPLTAVTTTTFKYMSGSVEITEDEPADHPCNWNKISVGEVMAIPLYYTDTNGDDQNLVTSASDLITVRVRTACGNGDVMCLPIDRFDFDIANDAPTYGINEPIMSWQITGEDDTTKASMVLGSTVKLGSTMLDPLSTIVSEFKIMGGKASGLFEVLYQSNLGEDLNKCPGSLLTYLRPAEVNTCTGGPNWNTTTIKKPVLKLSVIQSMIEPLGESIPYLEYQVLTNFSTSAPPTDTSQTITAEGYSGEFKQILEVKQPQEGGLLEYVIQQ